MKKYVLGFLFSYNNIVWLIEKNKPEWQKGKLNGIGGKVEEGETNFNAMVREFKEEAGLKIDTWKWYCTLTDDKSYEVYCYYAFSELFPKRTLTDERVSPHHLSYHLPSNTVPNVKWLIPMVLSFESGEHCDGFHVIEQLNKKVVAEII